MRAFGKGFGRFDVGKKIYLHGTGAVDFHTGGAGGAEQRILVSKELIGLWWTWFLVRIEAVVYE